MAVDEELLLGPAGTVIKSRESPTLQHRDSADSAPSQSHLHLIPVIPERYDQPSLPCILDVRKSGKWGKSGGRWQGYSSELITFPSSGVDDDPHQKED